MIDDHASHQRMMVLRAALAQRGSSNSFLRQPYMDPARVQGLIADAIWNSVAVIYPACLSGVR